MFLPLRREFFEAFATGEKAHEWRRYGARWNERSCAIGRPVVLALGYTRTRLFGRVVSFEVRPASPDAAALYGADARCAVIGIALDQR